jgi:hypothetical protein
VSKSIPVTMTIQNRTVDSMSMSKCRFIGLKTYIIRPYATMECASCKYRHLGIKW